MSQDNILDFILDTTKQVAGIVDTLASYDLGKSKIIAQEQLEHALLDKKLHAQNIKEKQNFEKEYLKGAEKANNTKIDSLTTEFTDYGTTHDDFVDLEKIDLGKWSTPEGKIQLENLGISINNDLDVTWDLQNNLKENINSLNIVTEIQDSIISETNSKLNVLRDLKKRHEQVNISDGFHLLDQVHDATDNIQYMYDNPEIFGLINQTAFTDMDQVGYDISKSLTNPEFKYHRIMNMKDPVKKAEAMKAEGLTDETLAQLNIAYENAAPIRNAFMHLGLKNHSQSLRDQNAYNNLMLKDAKPAMDAIEAEMNKRMEDYTTEWRTHMSSAKATESLLPADDDFIKKIGGKISFMKGDKDDIETLSATTTTNQDLTSRIGRAIMYAMESSTLGMGGSDPWILDNFKDFDKKGLGQQQALVFEFYEKYLNETGDFNTQADLNTNPMYNTTPIDFTNPALSDTYVSAFVNINRKDSELSKDFTNLLQSVNYRLGENAGLPERGNLNESEYIQILMADKKINTALRGVLQDTQKDSKGTWESSGLDFGGIGQEAGDYDVGSTAGNRELYFRQMLQSWWVTLNNPQFSPQDITPEFFKYIQGGVSTF